MEAPISRSVVYFALISGHSLVTETKAKRKRREPLDDMLKTVFQIAVVCLSRRVPVLHHAMVPTASCFVDFINIGGCVQSLALYGWLLFVYGS
jgi:hypothetical protein